MSDELAHVAPFVVPPAAVKPAPLPQPPAFDANHVRAVDAAFAAPQEQADHAMGLMGLALCSPWLLDHMRDHFRVPAEEEERPSIEPTAK